MIRRFEPIRALEVISPKYGSGYCIGGRLILTAAHILDKDKVGSICRVRSKQSFGETEATVVYKASKADIALIQLPDSIQPCEPSIFGLLPEDKGGEKLDFQMYGYPKWGRTKRDQGTAAGGRQVEGIIYLSDMSADELLVLEPSRLPAVSLDSGSDWEGNSGAAIVCDGLIIGVLRQHQNPERPASLEASPLYKVYDDEQWCCLLTEHNINPQPVQISHSNLTKLQSKSDSNLEEKKSLKTNILNINFKFRDESTHFVGRKQELQNLKNWILEEECRLIAILGMGGIGKSALSQMSFRKAGIGKSELSQELSKSIEEEFDYVVYLTLEDPLPFGEFIAQTLHFLSDQREVKPPDQLDAQIDALIQYLYKYRCFILVDNVETILTGLGDYKTEYQGYGKLFNQIGNQQHQSCLLLNSREKPITIYELEGTKRLVRSLHLEGLDCPSVKSIFASIADFQGTDHDWNELVSFYAGNPLALDIVARLVKVEYQGSISKFLRAKEEKLLQVGQRKLSNIQDLLDWTFSRLTKTELEILYWLSINSESTSASSLREDMLQLPPDEDIECIIEKTLDDRSLPIGRSSSNCKVQYNLQPVLREYTINRLVKEIIQEIKSEEIDSLNRFSIMKATSKDYIKSEQIRRIVRPILEEVSLEEIDSKLLQSRHLLPKDSTGYAAGNLLNLLLNIKSEVNGYNFSQLIIRQADLSSKYIRHTNFSGCDLTQSVFRESFSTIVAIDFKNDYAIAGTTSGEVHLWSFKDGNEECLRNYKAHDDWVWALAFSPCGNYFASGGGDKQVKLWNVASDDWTRVNVNHSARVRSLAFSPDGKYLATGGEDRDVRLWNIHTSQLEKIFEGHQSWANALTFSPDGKILACGSQGTNVRFWDVSTGQQLHLFSEYPKPISRVDFSPDGKLFAIAGDVSEIWLLDTKEWQCIRKLGTDSYKGRIRDISFSPDGHHIMGCCDDGVIRGWRIETGELYSLKEYSRANKKPLRAIAFNFDLQNQQILCGGEDQTLQLWNFNSLTCLRTIYGYTNPVWAVAFSPTSSLLVSGDEDHTVRLWNLSQDVIDAGKTEGNLLGTHENLIRKVSFRSDGKLLVTGSYDGTVKIWDITSGRLINTKRRDENRDRVIGVAFHPTDPILAISYYYGEKVNLWNYKTNELIQTLHLVNPNGEPTRARDVAFSPDGCILAISSEEHYIRLWHLQDNKYMGHLEGHTNAVWSLIFNQKDGTLVSCGGDGSIRIWDIKFGKSRVLGGHDSIVRAIAFSPDYTYLVSGGDELKIWKIESGECVATLKEHNSWIWSVSFSHDGLMIASGSDDQTIRIWDVNTNNCLMVLRPERPYEGTNIREAKGLTLSQREMLRALGAVED